MNRLFLFKIFWFALLITGFFLLPVYAQDNPLYESPLEAVTQELPKQAQETPPPAADEGDIKFDPEKGIILSDEETHVESGLDTRKKVQDQLISQYDRQVTPPEPVSPEEDAYIDRQIDKNLNELKGYLGEVEGGYKKVFSIILDKFVFMMGVVKEWPIVRNPPPKFVQILLAVLVYGLVSFPLMKIGRIIAHDEWMAWVPILQLVLLLRMTERSNWALLVFFIPIANLVLLASIFMEICDMLHRPTWYGVLILVPGVNILLLWYLAYAEIT